MSVQQTASGGYVAAGAYYTPTGGPVPTQVLVAGFGADGSLAWQHGFATVGSGSAHQRGRRQLDHPDH